MSTDVSKLDIEGLRSFFIKEQCYGIATLVEFLASPTCEGLSCIHLKCSKQEPLSSIYIGSLKKGETPLQWCVHQKENFSYYTSRTQECIDKTCCRFLQGTGNGGDMYFNGVRYHIPAGIDAANLSEKGLKPYQVREDDSVASDVH